MRLLLSVSACIALTLGVAQAYESGPPINFASMQSEYNKGHYPMAQYIGCQLLQRQPRNLAVHYLLGNCYVKFSQLDKATAEYKYCAHSGQGSQIGSFARTALEQMSAPPPSVSAGNGSGNSSNASSGTTSSTGSGESPPPSLKDTTAPPAETLDRQTLELKERLLKGGKDEMSANKVRMQKQIATIQSETEAAIQEVPDTIRGLYGRFEPNPEYYGNRERMVQSSSFRIKQLEDNNAAEDQKITARIQAQIDGLIAQRENLESRAKVRNPAATAKPKTAPR